MGLLFIEIIVPYILLPIVVLGFPLFGVRHLQRGNYFLGSLLLILGLTWLGIFVWSVLSA
ncbi:MAG: hypothetical protein WCV79_03175 [Candidatus Paceibacterota bacterium]|jgi:hypothetical protein